jgi:hypothetical protein
MATTITVSYSEIDTGRQCPHKHELAYKQRWVSPSTSQALSRGTAWHTILEGHYRIIQEWQRGGQEWSDTELRSKLWWSARQVLAQAGEEADLLEWMYEGYLEMYGLDLEYKILAVEHAPEVYLPTPTGGRSRFKLKMKMDLIVRWKGNIWILDHKSCKDLPKSKELDIDDQFGLYTWGMRQLGRPVFGSIHSAARTQRNKNQERFPQPLEERFDRKLLQRTDAELDCIAVEAYKTAKALYSWAPGEAPRSPNTDTCRWRCDYTTQCLLGRKGVDEQQILHDSGFVRDPTRH